MKPTNHNAPESRMMKIARHASGGHQFFNDTGARIFLATVPKDKFLRAVKATDAEIIRHWKQQNARNRAVNHHRISEAAWDVALKRAELSVTYTQHPHHTEVCHD